MAKVRLLHYLNQFFAGIGGEEKADVSVDFREGPLGPGKRLQVLCGESAEIAVTTYCGDNYFSEHHDEALASILQIARDQNINMLVAGPAFAAGRYGFACVEVCHLLSDSMGLDCVTGMHIENPAIEGYRQYKDRKVFILPAAETVSGMEEALSRMAQFVSKLSAGSVKGSAAEEGYIPRGFRVVEVVNNSGAQRAIDMLLRKAGGQSFASEIPVENVEEIPVAPPIANLSEACLALATTSGLVVKGNPDGFKMQRNTQWKRYSIEKLNSMQDAKWDVRHGGYNNAFVLENANYGVPLDVCRELEKEGVFTKICPSDFYTTPGINGLTAVMQRIGAEMASDMKAEGVNGVILVST